MKMRKSTTILWTLVSTGMVIMSGCGTVVLLTPPPNINATVETAVAATLTSQPTSEPNTVVTVAVVTQTAPSELTAIPTPIHQILLEAEDGTNNGEFRDRPGASNGKTVWLKTDEMLTITFDLAASTRYKLDVIASNDHVNGVSLETVRVLLDDEEIDHFAPVDTGDHGFGWNIFVTNYCIAPVTILAGEHSLTFYVTGGDGFGVEIDAIILTPTQ